MLQNIEINKIYPHPNNPRTDLGDLSELAESIKTNGVRQNLTLVPKEPDKYQKQITSKKKYTGDYTAIIGHRRIAAAQLAGLTEVPCIVVIMDESSQLATMLEENMQRSDLTPYEQAQGIQLMLDLGETVFTVAEKTGFSETTVRRRIRLLELDKEKLKEAEMRGATLTDYAELEKIKSVELKNVVLESIGTSNFNWELRRAIDKEENEAKKAALIEILDTFATNVENTDGMKTVEWLDPSRKFNKPKDADTEEYYYTDGGHYINLLRKNPDSETEKQAEKEQKKQLLKERQIKLSDISKRAYDMRKSFISSFNPSKNQTQEVLEFIARSLIRSGYQRFHFDMLSEMLWPNLTDEERQEFTFDDLAESFSAAPERVLLQAAYSFGMDMPYWSYYDSSCKYNENKKLDGLYDSLIKLGYEMSDEEKTLRDGTHELFVRKGDSAA